MSKIKHLISSYAFNQAKHKSFKDEHWLAILFVWTTRLITAGISIYSGWYYFINFLKPIGKVDSIGPYVFSVLLLVIVELLAAYTITKFTKSIIHKKIASSILIGLFASVIFGLSFFSSTNGLAARQSKKADNSDVILENSYLLKKQTNNNYNNQIAELKKLNELELENLQGWKNGERKVLAESQMKRIEANNIQVAKLNDLKRIDLIALKTEEEAQLKENSSLMMNESDKYWLFIAIVLAVSAISNISLQAFSHIILKQEAKALYLKGYARDRKQKIADAVMKHTLETVDEQNTNVLKELALTSILADKQSFSFDTKEATNDQSTIAPEQETKNPFYQTSRLNNLFTDFNMNFENNNAEKKKPPLIQEV